MFKLPVCIVLTALLALAMGYFLPWWTIAVAAFIVAALIRQSPGLSFFTGFAAIFLLWLILCLVINGYNHGILAPKVAGLMSLGDSVFLLMLITATLGAIVGGLGALCGSLLRTITDKK